MARHNSGKSVKYADTFQNPARERYRRKLRIISEKDPYEIPAKDWGNKVEDLPCISYPDIVNYLVNTQSAYTLSELKAYKSLEAYNYFISGWVKDIKTIILNGHHLVSSMVSILLSTIFSKAKLDCHIGLTKLPIAKVYQQCFSK